MSRKTKNVPQRSKFIILTNGRESEKNYFEAVRGRIRSIFDIKVEFENADPLGLVKRAIREKDTANRIWVVFDKDYFPEDAIYTALKLANENNIGVAFSNAAFEVWLINHFTEFCAEKSQGELLPIIDNLVKESGYSKGYNKNDDELVKKEFMPRLGAAVHNADVMMQKRIKDYNLSHPNSRYYPLCEWNSCTTVHRLIMALKPEKL